MEDGVPDCRKCVLVEGLYCQLKVLWEEVNKLHNMKDDKEEMNWTFFKTLQIGA